MALDSPGVDSLYSAIVSHAMSIGQFEKVNTHEPKNAPGNGLTCSIWVDLIKPILASGLAATSGLVSFHVRIHGNMLREPQDDVDPDILKAAVALMTAYTGDFDLVAVGSSVDVRNVDLLGTYGTPLSAQAGYLTIDQRMYRVMVVTLPVVINDLFGSQVA